MEECCRLCEEDPQYSLGIKLQKFMIRSTMDLRHKKMHKKELMDSLSDEELKIYNEEVKDLNMRKMVKEEFKRRGLWGKKAKERSSIPLGDGDGDIHIVPRFQTHRLRPGLLDDDGIGIAELTDLPRKGDLGSHSISSTIVTLKFMPKGIPIPMTLIFLVRLRSVYSPRSSHSRTWTTSPSFTEGSAICIVFFLPARMASNSEVSTIMYCSVLLMISRTSS